MSKNPHSKPIDLAQVLERIERLEKVAMSLGDILATSAIRPKNLDKVATFYRSIGEIRLGLTETDLERASKLRAGVLVF